MRAANHASAFFSLEVTRLTCTRVAFLKLPPEGGPFTGALAVDIDLDSLLESQRSHAIVICARLLVASIKCWRRLWLE